ncbi:bifunctional DNA-formamidopyrimidine glycosylase/DNA-(apurinic or apyrimidinic site) lyase [Candidatus Woesebacteria bacterium]|nr:bifunctional DNA-formamidopyrimidine glycosylase/DNA-(apurinic or apyrimidinic site) lyase [Candidatus Woesebacteria bacterium]
MPELPEVESIRKQLENYVVGHTIEDVEINYKKCFTGDPEKVKGGKIKKIRRFGKALSIDLDNNYSLFIHIKMTGQLIYRGPNLKNPPDISDKVKGGLNGKHNHVTFILDNHSSHPSSLKLRRTGKAREGQGAALYYIDYRKFGWIKIVTSDKIQETSFVNKLGPEPFKDLTLDKFSTVVQSTGMAIKNVLMDQSKIAGVGNIYANDALFLADIHPEKRSNKLNDAEVKKLFESIEKVLMKGLKYGGASEVSFVRPDGTTGNYQSHTLVYGKEGEKCPNGCGGEIKKIKVGGRGTYFCSECQKK